MGQIIKFPIKFGLAENFNSLDEVLAIMPVTLLIFAILAFTTHKVGAIEGIEQTPIECGTTNFTRGLISEGTKTTRAEWPFLTALFVVEENKCICGGTLISSKHVLTAAHCIQDKGSQFNLHPVDIIVLLGAYDLTSVIERGRQQRDVKEIYVHPEWKIYTDKYDADLAILLLSKYVVLTDYIRPVCIPADDTYIDNIRGSVVGWGLTENGTRPNKEFIKHAFVTALNSVYCLTEDPNTAVISSTRTFCARGKNGNANRGDSGGGFYVLSESSVWVQYGIISALRSNATGYVNASSVVVYTNVFKFKNWIVDTVKQSGAKVGEAKTNDENKINLECEFKYSSEDNYYGCFVDNLNMRSDNMAIFFTGSHVSEKRNQDVELFVFRNGTMFFIPSGVGQIFTNVKKLEVGDGLNTKRIKRSNFKSLENLVYLRIGKNDITTLDYDSLRDLQQLEKFVLVENSLREIDERTFETNGKLREVHMFENKLQILPRHLFRNNSLLELVSLNDNALKVIYGTTFETNINLKEVWLYGNKVKILPKHLFINNKLLEIVDVHDNSLKIIETDFSSFSNIKKIIFYDNICIDAYYEGLDDPKNYHNQFRNLTEFQNQIVASCSSPNS